MQSAEIGREARDEQRAKLKPMGDKGFIFKVAAGMRYLEDNGLCHRCLRASNILVSVEHEFALAVRITDYMLPYHALNDPVSGRC